MLMRGKKCWNNFYSISLEWMCLSMFIRDTDWTICNNFSLFYLKIMQIFDGGRNKKRGNGVIIYANFFWQFLHIFIVGLHGKKGHITFSEFGHNYCHYDSRCLYVFCCVVVHVYTFVNYMFLTFLFRLTFLSSSVPL